jgi:hypothetical protein
VAQTFGHLVRSGAQPGFRRDVGLVALTFVSLGSIIGSGWLLAVLPAATAAGGASVLSWALTGLVMSLSVRSGEGLLQRAEVPQEATSGPQLPSAARPQRIHSPSRWGGRD